LLASITEVTLVMYRPISTLILVAAVVSACGRGDDRPAEAAAGGTYTASSPRDVPIDKSAYPVFPNPDAGADPTVPAEQGGRGFSGGGWQTNTTFDLIGDPRAVQGGTFREAMSDFPATLRYIGPNLSTWNAKLSGMVYESLLAMHPTTLDYIPALATHWQVSPDRLTYRFRIDPNARWSDGRPVTAADVVATWALNVDPTVQDPLRNAMFNGFERPVAESTYIVRVRAKDPSWTNLYYFSGMPIYPAHVLKNVNGDRLVRSYNDRMLPGTGPYIVRPADIDKGNRLSISRRSDYWAEDYRRNVGLNNFDEVQQIVVRDRNLEFEMFKRGDLDAFMVNRAQMWVDELDFDLIERGLIQKRKIYNHMPNSIGGIALNTRRSPFDDIRVRRALRHLYHRELMVQKLMYGQYELMDSVYPGTIYENPDNEKVRYDPERALRLLAEAGWGQRDSSGRLVKNGYPLTLELLYYTRASEPSLTVFQEDLRRVGITLNLRYVTPETAFKLIDEQQFDMVSVAYGGGGPFPMPLQFFHSAQAGQKASTNITGFRNARADELIERYDRAFDIAERRDILRELDALVTAEHHWIMDWYAPYSRVLYWNKFGHPEGYITRIGDYRDLPTLWWLDPGKAGRLAEARRTEGRLPVGPSENRYWLDFARIEEGGTAGAAR
jgi:microcin C transport system substrate-binding protein